MFRIVVWTSLLGLLGAGCAGAGEVVEGRTAGAQAAPQEGHLLSKAGEGRDPLQSGPLRAGFDLLLRGESTNNFHFTDFTYTPGNSDQRALLRFRPSLTLTPTDYLSARVEGQWYAHNGESDSDKISLYQGFLEGALPGGKATLKVGRQEFVYGSSFMLGSDCFFDGLSFDAVKLGLRPTGELAIDLFAGRYTKDNSGGIEGELYGIYGTYTVNDDVAVDLYGLFDTGGEGLTHAGGQGERAWSVGARLAGKLGRQAAFEVEPVYQFGRHVENFTRRDIGTFGGHVDLTIDQTLGRYPVKGMLSYAFGSGDGDAADGTYGEFHNPNNDTPLIGDMSVIGDLSGVTAIDPAGNEVHGSGLHVITAGGGVDVTDRLNVSLDGHYFRAVRTPAGISKDIGFETNLILTYRITDRICLLASANRFFTGSFFRDATGSAKDIDYGYLQMQATF